MKDASTRYALVLNPDDFLYSEPIYRLLELAPTRIDSIYILPTTGSFKRQVLHVFTSLSIVGWRQALSAYARWVVLAFLAKSRLKKENPYYIESVAQHFGVPVFRFLSVNAPDFAEQIRSRGVSAILNVCSQIYKKSSIEGLPPIYNFHGGYVPGNAGRYPAFWAHRKGLPQVLSVHRVNEKIDDGPAVLHHPLRSGSEVSVHELMLELLEVFPAVVVKTIQLIESGQREVMDVQFDHFYGPRPTQKEIAAYHRDLKRVKTASRSST
jgi:hypothetical protein